MMEIPPVSEMPVAATMRPTRPAVAARGRPRKPLPLPQPPPSGPRRKCGNCAFAEDLSAAEVVCKRDGRGFSNNYIPNQHYPSDRNGCIYHAHRRNHEAV